MKKGERKPDSKWGAILDQFAALNIGEFFILEGDKVFANRLRSMLRISNRTMRWRSSIRAAGSALTVTKVGRW